LKWMLPRGQIQPQKNLPRMTVEDRSNNAGRALITKVREEIMLTRPNKGSVLKNKSTARVEGKGDLVLIRR